MKKKICLGFVIALTLIVASIIYIQTGRTSMKPTKIQATWLWHTDQIQEKPDEILQFLTSKKVTTLYLQVNEAIPIKEYESFLRLAKANNISVHALGGSPKWLSTKNGQEKRTAFFAWVENYQHSVEADARFMGIHLDVEPYLKDSWDSNYEETVSAYQTVLTEGKQLAEKLVVEYSLDIPFWFNNRFYQNDYGKGVLSEWLIDLADHVTIMAYRDQAEGENGILQLTKTDVTYAEKNGKSILIGIETLKSSEGKYLSFYQKDESTMNNELLKIENVLSSSSSFDGFAIHSIDGWMRMK